MKTLLRSVVVLLLLVSINASALVEASHRAYVISVDAKARTIKFRYTEGDGSTWKEKLATWDDKTAWSRSEENIYKSTPATAELASRLKKDTKIYVSVTHRDSGDQWWIDTLDTIPADSEMK